MNFKLLNNKDRIADSILQEHCDFSLIEMQGFIACMICEPREIDQKNWLDMLGIKRTDIKESKKTSKSEIIASKAMKECAIKHFDDIKNKLEHGKYSPITEFKKLVKIDCYEQLEKIARDWCKGFINGVSMGMLSYIGKNKQAELLHPIITLAVEDDILLNELENNKIDKSVKEIRQQSVYKLAEVVNSTYQYWLSDGEDEGDNKSRLLEFNFKEYYNKCMCGSGEKYKDCCLVLH
ncbi:MAG: UPF0149 family protein [Legionellales bacterium]|nr:UPF0149 family protein [Legionellales bacterium]